MSVDLIELHRCFSPSDAAEVLDLLKSAGISYSLGPKTQNFDISQIGSGGDDQVVVSVRAEDFPAARSAMERAALETALPADHHLLAASDDELVEILGQASEWSAFDVAHARRLLEQRGVDPAKWEAARKLRLERLMQGEKASPLLLLLGWFFASLGGVIGFAIGWSLRHLKTRVPEGEFAVYDVQSRELGKSIMLFSIGMALVWLVYCFVL